MNKCSTLLASRTGLPKILEIYASVHTPLSPRIYSVSTLGIDMIKSKHQPTLRKY